MLLGLGAVSLLPATPASAAGRVDPLLRLAMRRAGGRAALARVRVLRWRGDAIVHAGGRDIAIGVDTTVVPLHWARSTSWLASDGPAKARSMVITASRGWVERDGVAEPLPDAVVRHERAQFGLYALMLLAPLAGPRAVVAPLVPRGGRRGLSVELAPAPPTDLIFDADGRLAEARNLVPDPEGGAPVSQRFLFSAEAMPGPIRWPRRLSIEQRGEPYFELTLSRFEAARA